jgi:hypothetical protein
MIRSAKLKPAASRWRALSFADCGSPLMVIGLLEAGRVVLRYALRIL